MFQAVLLVFMWALSWVDAFAPIRCDIPKRTSMISQLVLKSVVDEPTVSFNTFDKIQDDGDLILLNDPVVDNNSPSEEGINELLNKALVESVKAVQDNFPPELLDDGALNIMEDESLKREISLIFDRASIDLKAALDDIRIEQEQFARLSAERSAAKSEFATRSDQTRLKQAEDSMLKMINKVNRESAEVERAVDQLRQAQANMSSDPLMKILNGGIVKQSALAGAILFSLRASADSFYMLQGNSMHAGPAIIQGALALGCAAYVLFS